MEYRTVGNRCAVDIGALKLSIPDEKILAILQHKGFKIIKGDIVKSARKYIGISRFHGDAKVGDAPEKVDCSSFTKWVYGEHGIWLPRRPIQQRGIGEPVELGKETTGDLIFTTGFRNFYDNDPSDGVGHVGIITGDDTVICATNSELGEGVVEISQNKLLSTRNFRGIRRYIPRDKNVITVEIPKGRMVETSDDIRWIILRSLHS